MMGWLARLWRERLRDVAPLAWWFAVLLALCVTALVWLATHVRVR